jgi:hypothetical protein
LGAVWRPGVERAQVLLAGDVQGCEPVVLAVPELGGFWTWGVVEGRWTAGQRLSGGGFV